MHWGFPTRAASAWTERSERPVLVAVSGVKRSFKSQTLQLDPLRSPPCCVSGCSASEWRKNYPDREIFPASRPAKPSLQTQRNQWRRSNTPLRYVSRLTKVEVMAIQTPVTSKLPFYFSALMKNNGGDGGRHKLVRYVS